MRSTKVHSLIIIIIILSFFSFTIGQDSANSTSNSSRPKEDPLPNAENVRYKLKHIDSPLADIHWCGKNYKEMKEEELAKPPKMIVLVLSHGGTMYRSEDDGFSWDEMRDTFADAGKQVDKKNKV